MTDRRNEEMPSQGEQMDDVHAPAEYEERKEDLEQDLRFNKASSLRFSHLLRNSLSGG